MTIFFRRFLSSQQCFRVVFRDLHDKRTQKHVLHCQISDLDVWTHWISWPRMTFEVWNGLKLLNNGWNTNCTAWLAVTSAKLRKLTLQTHLQIGSNNFTLTWPVTSQMTWKSAKFVFIDEFSRTIDYRFRVSDQFCSFGAMGGGSKWPPQWLVGDEEDQRLPGGQVTKLI